MKVKIVSARISEKELNAVLARIEDSGRLIEAIVPAGTMLFILHYHDDSKKVEEVKDRVQKLAERLGV